MKITNAYQNGTITPAEENAVWNATNNTLSVVFASDNVKDLVAGTGSGETEHMYLIPVASPQYTVTFTVVLDQNGATTEYPHTSTITTGMEKSKSYNSSLNLMRKILQKMSSSRLNLLQKLILGVLLLIMTLPLSKIHFASS